MIKKNKNTVIELFKKDSAPVEYQPKQLSDQIDIIDSKTVSNILARGKGSAKALENFTIQKNNKFVAPDLCESQHDGLPTTIHKNKEENIAEDHTTETESFEEVTF